jgi:hypothetical protein
VGDTPLTLVDDHVLAFRPDHLLFELRSGEYAGRQEKVLEDIAASSGLPMTVFEIDQSGRAYDRSCT